MNDLELYREQLAECDDRIIDALVERNSNSSVRLKKNCRTIVMKKRLKMCSTVL